MRGDVPTICPTWSDLVFVMNVNDIHHKIDGFWPTCTPPQWFPEKVRRNLISQLRFCDECQWHSSQNLTIHPIFFPLFLWWKCIFLGIPWFILIFDFNQYCESWYSHNLANFIGPGFLWWMSLTFITKFMFLANLYTSSMISGNITQDFDLKAQILWWMSLTFITKSDHSPILFSAVFVMKMHVFFWHPL